MPKVFLTEKPIDSLAINPPFRSANVYGSQCKIRLGRNVVRVLYSFATYSLARSSPGKICDQRSTHPDLGKPYWRQEVFSRTIDDSGIRMSEFLMQMCGMQIRKSAKNVTSFRLFRLCKFDFWPCIPRLSKTVLPMARLPIDLPQLFREFELGWFEQWVGLTFLRTWITLPKKPMLTFHVAVMSV